jgi:hypothetical protein
MGKIISTTHSRLTSKNSDFQVDISNSQNLREKPQTYMERTHKAEPTISQQN